MKKFLVYVLFLLVIPSIIFIPSISYARPSFENYFYDAQPLPNGNIAIVSSMNLDLYYGESNPLTEERTSTLIAEGKDAALAIDSSGNPHIAYITADDKLGYIYFNGTTWSTPEIIESISYDGIGGAISYPDIEVDSSGKVHIIYLDSNGGYESGYDPACDRDDLIYLTNSTGTFVKKFICYGQGVSSWTMTIFSRPKITLVTNSYYIYYKTLTEENNESGQKFTYRNNVSSISVGLSDIVYFSTVIEDVNFYNYDIESYSFYSYYFYNYNNTLHVKRFSTTLPDEILSAQKEAVVTKGDLFLTDAGEMYYAGANYDQLLLYQNGDFKENITLPGNVYNRLVTFVISGKQYVVFTNGASKIYVCNVSTNSGESELNSYEYTLKMPVTISGVTVENFEYSGINALYSGTPSSVVTSSGDSVVIPEYTYTWYDVTNNQTLTEVPKNVGEYKLKVTVASSNAIYEGLLEIPFTIGPKTITINEISATDRTYNGLNTVELTGGVLEGVIEGDDVSPIVPATGTMSTPDVGSDKAVDIPEVTLTGEQSANYTLSDPEDALVIISKAPITIDSVVITNKPYDKNTSCEVSDVTFIGMQNGETLELNVDYTTTQQFEDYNSGNNTVTGTLTLNDTTKANNYEISDGSFTTLGQILRIEGLSATNPANIIMEKGQEKSYTYDLSKIALNKTDAGAIRYRMSGVSGKIFSEKPYIDGNLLYYVSSSESPVETGTMEVLISAQNYLDTTVILTFEFQEKKTSSGGRTLVIETIEENQGKKNTTNIDSVTNDNFTKSDVSNVVVEALLEKSKITEGNSNQNTVEVNVKTQENTNKLSVNFSESGIDKISDKSDSSLSISSPFVSMVFDGNAVEEIANNKGGVEITAEIFNKSNLSEEESKLVKDSTVYDFTVLCGNTKVSNFNSGNVKINIPYTLKSDENPNTIIVYYMSDEGKLEIVRGHYKEATKTVEFITDHFSKYVISHNSVKFSDVSQNDWYKDAVDFIAAREITTGTGNNNFNPNEKITRGQFVVLLMNAYKIKPIANTESINNFSDAGNTYYTNYLAKAKSLGIINGIGNNMYAPEKEITRQEMFVILYNALKNINQLPTSSMDKKLDGYKDVNQVSNWALEATNYLVNSNVVKGANNNINPNLSTTRAETAQVLYNLLTK